MTSYPNYNAAFQRHRRRPNKNQDQNDLLNVLDFSSQGPSFMNHPNSTVFLRQDKGSSIYPGPLYELTTHPGFVYAPRALSPCLQHQLAFLALTEFCTFPHVTNIVSLSSSSSSSGRGTEEEEEKETQRVNHNNQSVDVTPNLHLWEQYKQQQQHQPQNNHNKNHNKITTLQKSKSKLESNRPPPPLLLLDKLSWATLGYHYNWTKRQYTQDCHSEIPSILHILSNIFASTLVSSFTTSAVIVNYYSLKSTMGGHQDDLEYDFTKPVISINLGLPAIFLLGQVCKEKGPVIPILIRPGDVLIMGGESRLCFHGIARIVSLEEWKEILLRKSCFKDDDDDDDTFIIQDTTSLVHLYRMSVKQLKEKDEEGEDKLGGLVMSKENSDAVHQFLSCHRININMRQVLPDGMESINDFKNKI